MRSYPVKENHIGSAVIEILRYKHTNTEISCYFIIRIVINLPRTYEKLPCKGESNLFCGQRDPSVQTNRHTDKQTSFYFIIRIYNTYRGLTARRLPRFFTKLDRVSFIVGYYNYDSLFVSLCHLKKPNRQAPKIGFLLLQRNFKQSNYKS